MREEKRGVERIDEAMNDEKLTWDKPSLKLFSIDDTSYRGGPGADGLDESGVPNNFFAEE